MRRLSRTLSTALAVNNTLDSVDDGRYSDTASESKAEAWHMMPEIKALEQQAQNDQNKARKLGVTWKNLKVQGIGADAAFNENVWSQFNVSQAIHESRQPAPLKTIIENSHGCVKPGEMLLVLGVRISCFPFF